MAPSPPGVACLDFAEEQSIVTSTHTASEGKGLLCKIKAFRDTLPSGTTYLLSVSKMRMLHHCFPLETITSLLSVPNTIIIFLVPIQMVFSPQLYSYTRVPRAKGSCIQVQAFNPVCDREDKELVKCVAKICKQRPINGFMSFDEDWESRCRLASIVKKINCDRTCSAA
jgi:hypothetical protein